VNAATPKKPQQHGLGLVVFGMSGGNVHIAEFLPYLAEKGIPHVSRPHFDAAVGDVSFVDFV
jgi:hypothetical protein